MLGKRGVGDSIAAEHTATPVNNNLSITRFGRSLSLSSETAAEFPEGKYRLGHVWCILLAYSLSCRRPADVQEKRRAKHTFRRPFKQEWHTYRLLKYIDTHTAKCVWEEQAGINLQKKRDTNIHCFWTYSYFPFVKERGEKMSINL